MNSKMIRVQIQGEKVNNLAAILVQTAMRFQSHIEIVCGDRRANAKSLLGILSLQILYGDTLQLYADGQDSLDALTAMEEVLRIEQETPYQKASNQEPK